MCVLRPGLALALTPRTALVLPGLCNQSNIVSHSLLQGGVISIAISTCLISGDVLQLLHLRALSFVVCVFLTKSG